MSERVVFDNETRSERVTVEIFPAHGLLDLIVETDGLEASARLDKPAAVEVRDALDEFIRRFA